MTCPECRELLSALLDGELPSDDAATAGGHLAGCAECRAAQDGLRALKHAVARLPSREEPPGAVRARVEALRFAPPRRGRLAALVAAGALAAVAVTLAFSLRADPAGELAAELVADHLRSLPDVKPAEVASHDPREVARFFAGRTPFLPVVPSVPGSTLLGGRLCRIKGRLFQLLFYAARGETLSLFVSGATGVEHEPGCRDAQGHHVCASRRGDVDLLLVGRLPAPELRRLLAEASL